MTDHTVEELREAHRAIASMISKIDKTLAGLKPEAKAQRTLAERRLQALRIAEELLDREGKAQASV